MRKVLCCNTILWDLFSLLKRMIDERVEQPTWTIFFIISSSFYSSSKSLPIFFDCFLHLSWLPSIVTYFHNQLQSSEYCFLLDDNLWQHIRFEFHHTKKSLYFTAFLSSFLAYFHTSTLYSMKSSTKVWKMAFIILFFSLQIIQLAWSMFYIKINQLTHFTIIW